MQCNASYMYKLRISKSCFLNFKLLKLTTNGKMCLIYLTIHTFNELYYGSCEQYPNLDVLSQLLTLLLLYHCIKYCKVHPLLFRYDEILQMTTKCLSKLMFGEVHITDTKCVSCNLLYLLKPQKFNYHSYCLCYDFFFLYLIL